MDLRRLAKRVLPTAVAEAARARRAVRRSGHHLSFKDAFAPWVGFLQDLPPGLLAGRPVVAVDVGAHVGEWTAALLRIRQTTRVIAIEPSPKSVSALRERFGAEPRVTIAPVAAGREAGTLTLRLTSSSDFNSALPLSAEIDAMYTGVTEIGTEEVPVTTLDALLADVPSVTLMKIDVQGFEPQVLAGATEVLRRTRCIMIECNFRSHYDGDARIWDLNPLLEQAGFRLYRLGQPCSGPDGSILWADAVYVPSV